MLTTLAGVVARDISVICVMKNIFGMVQDVFQLARMAAHIIKTALLWDIE